MSKFIIVDFCNECPHIQSESIYGVEDSYKAICNHPNICGISSQIVKIKNKALPLHSCPLPNYLENE